MPRLVVLTQREQDASRFLARLNLLGVIPEGILVADRPAPAAQRMPLRAWASLRLGRRPGAEPGRDGATDADALLRGGARELHRVGPLGGDRTLAALSGLQPDWLLLHGAGLVSRSVLALPRRGTLNVHPGLLPWVRGSGVVHASLARDVPAGVTLHLVDAGIDTGRIVQRQLVPVTGTDTLASLALRCHERAQDVFLAVAAAIARGTEPPRAPLQPRYPICRWPTPDAAAIAADALADGKGVQLYERWRSWFGGDVIPNEAGAFPAVAVEPIEKGSGDTPPREAG